jgi:hypothetical protein
MSRPVTTGCRVETPWSRLWSRTKTTKRPAIREPGTNQRRSVGDVTTDRSQRDCIRSGAGGAGRAGRCALSAACGHIGSRSERIAVGYRIGRCSGQNECDHRCDHTGDHRRSTGCLWSLDRPAPVHADGRAVRPAPLSESRRHFHSRSMSASISAASSLRAIYGYICRANGACRPSC